MEIANYIPDSSIEMEMTPNGMCVRNRNRYISKTGLRFDFKFWFLHFQQTLCEIEIYTKFWQMNGDNDHVHDTWCGVYQIILFNIKLLLEMILHEQ